MPPTPVRGECHRSFLKTPSRWLREFAKPILEALAKLEMTTTERDVAEAIWQAVQDTENQLRFAAGADAVALA